LYSQSQLVFVTGSIEASDAYMEGAGAAHSEEQSDQNVSE